MEILSRRMKEERESRCGPRMDTEGGEGEEEGGRAMRGTETYGLIIHTCKVGDDDDKDNSPPTPPPNVVCRIWKEAKKKMLTTPSLDRQGWEDKEGAQT